MCVQCVYRSFKFAMCLLIALVFLSNCVNHSVVLIVFSPWCPKRTYFFIIVCQYSPPPPSLSFRLMATQWNNAAQYYNCINNQAQPLLPNNGLVCNPRNCPLLEPLGQYIGLLRGLQLYTNHNYRPLWTIRGHARYKMMTISRTNVTMITRRNTVANGRTPAASCEHEHVYERLTTVNTQRLMIRGSLCTWCM